MNNLLKTLSAIFKQSAYRDGDNAKYPQPEISDMDPIVPENLFIEKENPEVNESVTVNPSESKLASFLKRDFSKIGYSDGYRYHASDVFDNYKRLLRSEFREIMDFMIDDLQSNQATLHKHLVDVRSFSSKAAEKISNRIHEIQQYIGRLEGEKALSSVEDGLVMRPIHLYRDGFLRGMEDYNEEILLMSYSPLFR